MERRGNAVKITGNLTFPRMSYGAIADFDDRMAANSVVKISYCAVAHAGKGQVTGNLDSVASPLHVSGT
jgi:hypothetical protein